MERRLPKNVLSDSTIEFTVYKSSKDYPIPLRRVVYYDEEQDREFVFLTNDFELPALIIAELYRNRWSVESSSNGSNNTLKSRSFGAQVRML